MRQEHSRARTCASRWGNPRPLDQEECQGFCGKLIENYLNFIKKLLFILTCKKRVLGKTLVKLYPLIGKMTSFKGKIISHIGKMMSFKSKMTSFNNP